MTDLCTHKDPAEASAVIPAKTGIHLGSRIRGK